MEEVPIQALKEAILHLHGCNSTFLESVPVLETFRGKTAWEGIVKVFELHGHPTATRCYAWSHAVEGSGAKRRFVVVLREGKIDSPLAAVQAAIASEAK